MKLEPSTSNDSTTSNWRKGGRFIESGKGLKVLSRGEGEPLKVKPKSGPRG